MRPLALLLLLTLLLPGAAWAEGPKPGPGCRWSVADDGWVFDPPASLRPRPAEREPGVRPAGVEVYAWQNAGGYWRYRILPAAAGARSRAEVRDAAPGEVLSTRGLEFRLREMPRGRVVTLLPLPLDPALSLTARTLQRLGQVARTAGVEFSVRQP